MKFLDETNVFIKGEILILQRNNVTFMLNRPTFNHTIFLNVI